LQGIDMVDDEKQKGADAGDHPVPEVREAHDAEHHDELRDDPSDESAIAEIASDESFPASDPPSHTVQGGGEPAPSSGYDEQEERAIAVQRSEPSEAEPLSYGTVRNGGAYQRGAGPEDAVQDESETRAPLDARTHFGGDGAPYEAPEESRRQPNPSSGAVGPGEDGYDEAASKPMDLDVD
jgi:hypothetical protein